MTSKESREWAASVEQSPQQVVADSLASITHWRMVQARNERRKMYPYRSDAAQRGSKTMNVNQTLCVILSPEEGDCGAVMLNTQSTSTTVLQALVDAGYIKESCGLSVKNDGRYFFIARDDELILAINHLGAVSLEDKELSP